MAFDTASLKVFFFHAADIFDQEKLEDPCQLILQRFFDLLFQKVTLTVAQRA